MKHDNKFLPYPIHEDHEFLGLIKSADEQKAGLTCFFFGDYMLLDVCVDLRYETLCLDFYHLYDNT